MLKIGRSFSLLFLVLAVFGYTSAQTPSSLLDELEVISADNVSRLEQVAEITYVAGIVRFVSWSPDGTHLAVIREGDEARSVEIWDVTAETLPTVPILTITPNSVDRLRWLPDGESIVTHGQYRSDDGIQFEVQRWDVNTGEVIEILLDAGTKPANAFDPVVPPVLGWNSDYTQSAIFIDPRTFQLSDGRIFSGDYGEFGTILRVEWSPDDHYLVVLYVIGYESYRFNILDAQTLDSELFVMGGDDYYVYDMVWSPNSTTLAVVSVDEGVFVQSTNIRPYRVGEEVCYGSCERRFAVNFPENYVPNFNTPMGVNWSPDNKIIAIGTPTSLSFFDPETLAEIVSISASYTTSLSWHPSGRLMATGNTDGTIHLWGVPSD